MSTGAAAMQAHYANRSFLKRACDACASAPECPPALRVVCTALAQLAHKHKTEELHSLVHACRDIASRAGVRACRGQKAAWQREAVCCFQFCDACDRFCHQRCALPDAMAQVRQGKQALRCALRGGTPHIPGSAPTYVAPTSVDGPCVVYCASTSCVAASTYAHKVKGECWEYPGGVLEYACRTTCDASLPKLALADFHRAMALEFNGCGRGPHACHP